VVGQRLKSNFKERRKNTRSPRHGLQVNIKEPLTSGLRVKSSHATPSPPLAKDHRGRGEIRPQWRRSEPAQRAYSLTKLNYYLLIATALR